MREYGKVFSSIYESDDYRSLSEDGRTLVLYLLICKHATIAGVFRVPDGYVCEDLQWTQERVSKGFDNLAEKGFATRCASTLWVWVTKFLEWNPPENPNQRKAAAKVVARVPDQCSWRHRFLSEIGPSLGIEPPPLPPPPMPPAANPSATVAKPFLNQEQEQEQEQEHSDADASGGEPPDADVAVAPVEVIFGLGIPLLTQAGIAEKQARTFLGLQRKLSKSDQKVADAIRQAIDSKAMQPLEFIVGVLKTGKVESSHSGFDSKNYHAGANEDGSF